jgi:RimJ/RimL family protein N-acetyltransferase
VLLQTERLTIRPWRDDEAPRLLDILRREEIVRWLGHPKTLETVDEARERIAGMAQEPPLGEWAMELTATREPVGSVMLVGIPKSDGLVQIGWYLHPDSTGHGYVTEAAKAVLTYGLDHGLDEIRALTHTDNEPSKAVALRVGMTQLDDTDQWYDDPSSVFLVTRDTWRG